MPSGKVHDRIAAISILPALCFGSFVLHYKTIDNVFFVCFLIMAQLIFSPDLDIRSYQSKRWGIFKWIWIPYRMIFKHRSGFSHGIITGTLLRTVYLIIAVFLIVFSIDYFLYFILGGHFFLGISIKFIHMIYDSTVINFRHLMMLATFAIFSGAAIQTFTDKIVSFLKGLL